MLPTQGNVFTRAVTLFRKVELRSESFVSAVHLNTQSRQMLGANSKSHWMVCETTTTILEQRFSPKYNQTKQIAHSLISTADR